MSLIHTISDPLIPTQFPKAQEAVKDFVEKHPGGGRPVVALVGIGSIGTLPLKVINAVTDVAKAAIAGLIFVGSFGQCEFMGALAFASAVHTYTDLAEIAKGVRFVYVSVKGAIVDDPDLPLRLWEREIEWADDMRWIR